MQNLDFGSQNNHFREFTGCLFEGQRVYAGDLVEYRKDGQKEIGEVRKRDEAYLVGGKSLEELEILRVIDMGGAGADGRYI
jgi:hypothetical protein